MRNKTKKVAIIGGTGRMGSWFAKFFRDKGFHVIISGRKPKKTKTVASELKVDFTCSILDAVSESDIVVFATPIGVTSKVIREAIKNAKKGAILFDIASIKGDIVKTLRKIQPFGVRTFSLHPMFGHGAQSINGKKLLLIPTGADLKEIQTVTRLFEEDGAIINIVPNAETHDKMVALTLSLTHFINLLFVSFLTAKNIVELKKFGGTTFP
ncbi:MAG: prephenate dehydrogenase/arogenate dehydrogenase family protein, partial [Candidatus Bathyarchaeota archaeon]